MGVLLGSKGILCGESAFVICDFGGIDGFLGLVERDGVEIVLPI